MAMSWPMSTSSSTRISRRSASSSTMTILAIGSAAREWLRLSDQHHPAMPRLIIDVNSGGIPGTMTVVGETSVRRPASPCKCRGMRSDAPKTGPADVWPKPSGADRIDDHRRRENYVCRLPHRGSHRRRSLAAAKEESEPPPSDQAGRPVACRSGPACRPGSPARPCRRISSPTFSAMPRIAAAIWAARLTPTTRRPALAAGRWPRIFPRKHRP